MAYYTNYTLTVYPESARPEILLALAKLPYFEGEDNIDDALSNDNKWDGWQAGCTAISAQLPDCLISLVGQGEDTGDLWRADFMGGEMVASWQANSAVLAPDAELIKKACEASNALNELKQLNLYVSSHVMGFENKAYNKYDVASVSYETLVKALEESGFEKQIYPNMGLGLQCFSDARLVVSIQTELLDPLQAEPTGDKEVTFKSKPTVSSVERVIRALALARLFNEFNRSVGKLKCC